MKKTIIFGLMFLMLLSLVTAIDQTQQSNKIFLNPFYRASTSLNTNYNYTLMVNPPDGVSAVTSAIITFKVYMTPTVTFNLTVNGQSCNNPLFTVSTTFSGSGQGEVTFDCSNRITKAGLYNIVLRPTQANTGAITGWLDLTYMNKPGNNLEVFGTEYQYGDNGKTFVQLLENGITPINNATCYGTVFYPNGVKWYDKTLMTYQTGSNALYYLDFTAPSTSGVYMVDVYCEYYTSTRPNNATAYVIANGTYMFGTGGSLTVIDQNYLGIAEYNYNQGYYSGGVTTVLMGHLDEYTGTSTLDSSLSPTTGTHIGGVTTGVTGISGFAAKYDGVNDYTLYTDVSKFDLTASEQYMVCFGFNESVSNANGNRIVDSLGGGTEGFRFSFDGGNQIRFVSDRAGTGGQTVQSTTTYIDSNWHTVCGYANFTNMILYIDGAIADSQARTQSGAMTIGTGIGIGATPVGASFANVAVDEVCYMKATSFSGASAPGTLATAYNTNKQCGTGNNVLDLNTSITGISILSDAVHYDIVTTYTYSESGENIDVYLWNYTGSSWYKLANSLSYAVSDSTVSTQLTINITQFLSGGNMLIRYADSNNTGELIGILKLDQVRLDQTNYVDLPINSVRGGGELHITDYFSNIPSDVWAYVTRTLTAYPNITASIDTALVAESVWNATNRTLTYYPEVNNTAIANEVWNATNRTLTYYPTAVDYTLIQGYVWNATSRNLTYYPAVSINASEIAQYTWNYTARYTHGVVLN